MFAAEVISYFIRQHSNIKNEIIVLVDYRADSGDRHSAHRGTWKIYLSINFDSEIIVFIIFIDYLFYLYINNFNNKIAKHLLEQESLLLSSLIMM